MDNLEDPVQSIYSVLAYNCRCPENECRYPKTDSTVFFKTTFFLYGGSNWEVIDVQCFGCLSMGFVFPSLVKGLLISVVAQFFIYV